MVDANTAFMLTCIVSVLIYGGLAATFLFIDFVKHLYFKVRYG